LLYRLALFRDPLLKFQRLDFIKRKFELCA
jgi:hypothetical protein